MMTDKNGDGFLGKHNAIYVLGRKKNNQYSFIVIEALLVLLFCIGFVIFVLMYFNVRIGTEVLQTIIAGRQ